jgi:hypothetical protein
MPNGRLMRNHFRLTRAARRGTVGGLGDRREATMRRGLLQLTSALAIAAMTGGFVTTAWSANIFELNFWLSGPRYDSKVPLCDAHGPLDRIMTRFGTKEYRFWNSKLEIVGFDNIREIAWEPWQSGTIPRRYCIATALVSDGKRHEINYSIIEDAGIIGIGYGVEWCVTSLDRNWAYNPSCRWARP